MSGVKYLDTSADRLVPSNAHLRNGLLRIWLDCRCRSDQRDLLLLFFVNLAANIRPEFFHDQRHCIPPNLRAPDARGVCQSLIFPWVVTISRNAGRNCTADDLRIVELISPGIGAGNKYPADSVTCPVPEPSLSRLKKPGILMEYGRKNRTGEIVL